MSSGFQEDKYDSGQSFYAHAENGNHHQVALYSEHLAFFRLPRKEGLQINASHLEEVFGHVTCIKFKVVAW